MSYGLRVWDGAGNLTIDVTDRLSRLHSTYSAYIADGWVTLYVPGLRADGTWAAVAYVSSSVYDEYLPYVLISNDYVQVRRFYSQAALVNILVFRY